MKYKIEIRFTAPLGSGRWQPGVRGTLNQTGTTDDAASTFDTHEEAESVAREWVAPSIPEGSSEWRIEKVP